VTARLCVLGDLGLHDGDVRLTPSGPMARALLAVLALHPREPVATTTIRARLWGEDTPAHHRKQVRTAAEQVGELVGAVTGTGWTLESIAGGSCYRLDVPEEASDLLRFRRHAAEARGLLHDGRFTESAEAACRARESWSGSALADVPAARQWPELARLREERHQADEDRLRADLAAGTPGVVEGLAAMARAEPGREVVRAMLMAALLADGRDDEARQVYTEARSALQDEWGLDPGPELAQQWRLASGAGRAPAARVHGSMLCLAGAPTGLVDGLVEEPHGRVVWESAAFVVALFQGPRHAHDAVATALESGTRARRDHGVTDVRAAVVEHEQRASCTGPGARTGRLVAGAEIGSCRALLAVAGGGLPVVDRPTHDATADAVAYRRCGEGDGYEALRMLDRAQPRTAEVPGDARSLRVVALPARTPAPTPTGTPAGTPTATPAG
jgi:DNA-binding SARP family transcriptional activator